MSEKKQKTEKVYSFLDKYISENGFPPSVREICAAVGIRSTASCQEYLNDLEQEGKIVRTGLKKRAITVVKGQKTDFISVPVIGTVAAGTPIFAYENLEEYCPLPKEFGEEDELFMLKVKGDSMVECGIFDGDKVVVQKRDDAVNGEIIVAFVDDSATVKRFFKKKDSIVLHPENSAMEDIILPDVRILGKVVGLIRKF
ncbi:MAG TPA: hypothetical protein DDW54_02775 [Clostridiales bacterium]|nr:hypothetical protein [Clostridiales bacterium]